MKRFGAAIVRKWMSFCTPWMVRLFFARKYWWGNTQDIAAADVLIVNHTSFWDGILLFALWHVKGSGRELRFLVDDKVLNSRPWLRAVGCRSVCRGSPDHLLRVLEQEPKACWVLFPQGRHQPTEPPFVIFEGGLRVLEQYCRRNQKRVFVGYCYYFWQEAARPSLALGLFEKAFPINVPQEWKRMYCDIQPRARKDFRLHELSKIEGL